MASSRLALLLGVLAVLAPASAQLPPFCAPTFSVQADKICETFKLTTSYKNPLELAQACGVITLFEGLAQNVSNLVCRTSTGGGLVTPPALDLKNVKLPQPLRDARAHGRLPASLKLNATFAAEGATFNWFYRALTNLNNWAPCAALGNNAALPAPTGYSTAAVINLPQGPQSPIPQLPFAVLYKAKPDAGHRIKLVLLLRGSLSLPEWILDQEYNQTSNLAFGPGSFHSGFATVAKALLQGGLEAALRAEINAGATSLTIGGYSLGAGVGQLIALRANALFAGIHVAAASAEPSGTDGRKHRDGKCKGDCGGSDGHYGGGDGHYGGGDGNDKRAAVTTVLFGAPNVGDAAWAEAFDRAINSRSIAFQADSVPQIACAPQMIACPTPPVAISTANPPSNVWRFTRSGGNLVYPAAAMPLQTAAWAATLTVTGPQICDVTAFKQFYASNHICSYMCMTSPFVAASNNLCQLTNLLPPGGATPCSF